MTNDSILSPIPVTSDMIEQAISFVQTLLVSAGFSPTVSSQSDTTIALSISDDYDAAQIIGKEGAMLMAMQTITQSYLARKYNCFLPVFLDCNDYFSYRIEKAKQKALDVARQLNATHPSAALPPMSSVERKAIHELFKNDPTYSTHSVGVKNDRHLVVSLNL
jgi:spoIIIJ-associated protein